MIFITTDTEIQIKATLGGAPHSEFSNVQDMLARYYVKRGDIYEPKDSTSKRSILTPNGFRFLGSLKRGEDKRLIHITYIINGVTRASAFVPEGNEIIDFETQERLKVEKLTDKQRFITYLNTDTDCRGFHIKRAKCQAVAVDRTTRYYETLELLNTDRSFNSCFANRILLQW